ncbi:hypothetical protein G979_01097, partial [Escherichia coli UMEA 3609-1]
GEKRVFLVILFTSFSGSLVSRIPGAVQYEDIQQPAQQQTQQATSGGQTFREGMTAKNPKTGQKIIYRNGQWQPM